jgi:hypothetical protein
LSIVDTSAGKTTLDTIKSNDDVPMWNAVQQSEEPKRVAEGGLLIYDATEKQYLRPPEATNPVPFPVTQSKRSVDPAPTVLQSAITAPAVGNPYTISGKDKLILAISGTATERTVEFKVIGPGGVEGYVLGSKIGSGGSITLAASSSAIADELWEFDGLAGYTSFYAKVTALTGVATVTVLGVA